MVVKNQAERLASRGHKVTVVTSKCGLKDRNTIYNKVSVKRIIAANFLEKYGIPFPVFWPVSLFTVLVAAIRKADAVHIHDAVYMPCMAAAIIAKLLHKPLVVTQHVAIVQHPNKAVMAIQKAMHTIAGHIVYRSSHSVFTLNDRVAAHVVAYGATVHKLKEAMNGVDTTLFHPATDDEKIAARKQFGLALNKPVVLFVGRFVPKKGFTKVVAARSDAYQLVCAGGERRANNEPGMTYIGKLPQTELATLYRAADVFVLPSENEGFPLSVQEAMASGLPIIIASDEGYARYGFDTNLICCLSEVTDQTVRVAISELINDTAKQRRMRDYSFSYATHHFSWENIIVQLEALYEQLVPQKGRL